ncbi:MAG TPA: CDP-glycerol glycerophosphotransferase family protein [Candidatus Moranbacteria bacterium]|nr:CDP-glycerol glycerophosphotransferase family protein [Candidatus Moranbacteria bacterium]
MGAFKQNKYKENPNPQAKIGFVIFYPFQFYVFKNVYKNISQEAEFIIDMGAFFPIKQPEELLDDIYALLKKNGVFFRILHFEDYYSEAYLKDFFQNFSALVLLWNRGCYQLTCNASKKKICMQYGGGKDLAAFALWKKNFDLLLAYGKRDNAILSLLAQSKIVGNPKFDDWFNNNFDNDLISKVGERLDKSKKTALYLPTHSDLSSLEDLADELKLLTKNYNVIIKLHYYSPREEPEKINKIKEGQLIILNDDADLLSLLKISDVVISDNSSAIFDVILADKPLVTTDFISDKYLEKDHKIIKEARRGQIVALTYPGSIEQRIKKEGLIISIKQPSELQKGLEEAIKDDQFFKDSRKKIREDLFSFNDGQCGRRAAEEIINLMNSKNKTEKPLFFHLTEVYFGYGASMFEINSSINSQFNREIKEYQKRKRFKSFAAQKFLEGAARKIFNEGKFGKKKYSYTIFSPLRRMLLYRLLGGKGIKPAFIIFSGAFFTWLGGFYAATTKYKQRK